VKTLRAAFARRPTYFAFYVGRGDDRFRDENERFHRELDAARVPHVFRVYAGGHEQCVWSAHAQAWLAVAVDHLAH
jgi:enterochelin esterase-like enzyme